MKNTGKSLFDLAILVPCLAAGCVGEPSPDGTATAVSELGASSYYSVSDSQNPFGLEGEVEAYGPMTAIADLNNDGHLDLAIENNYTAVMVRLGDGNGGFGAENRYGLGGGMVRPNAVIANDLNADGNADLVTSNDMSLSVLMNNGDGTFGAATSYAIAGCNWGPCHGSVTSTDFNGDGKPDLATGMYGGIGVLFGNGDGTFGALTTYACGATTHHNSVTPADFNGDGKLDLATAASWGSTVHIFAGNGDGTFAACTSTTVGSRPQSMTAGDFNQDGRPDLATANSWGISVTVLINQGNGTFATQSYPFAGDSYDMLFVGAANVDSDGIPDLLVGHQSAIFVMSGSPAGTFSTTHVIALDAPARFVAAADLDHAADSRADLVVSSDAGRVIVMRGERGSEPCTSGCTPTVVGSTQAASGSASPGASGGLTIARPDLLRDGDVLYAFLTKADDVGTLSAPAGWTQIGQWATTADDDFTTGLWRKVVTSAGSEPASYRWTHTDNTAEEMSGYVVAVRGANPAAPEEAVAHAAGTNDPTPDSPSVTTTSPSALVLLHQGVTHMTMSKIQVAYGATLLQSTRGSDRNSGVAAYLQGTPGATGIRNWFNRGGASGADWHTLTLAVRPL